nr:MAG TPA: hypothetical protein [Caudoviricetes sp.]
MENACLKNALVSIFSCSIAAFFFFSLRAFFFFFFVGIV